LAALLFWQLANAEELSVCFNYGCSTAAPIILSASERHNIAALFEAVDGAEGERASIARAVATMHDLAATQTPTRNDRPGNFEDELVSGRMDCIDHASNSTTYLNFLQARGWLKHHRVLTPLRRAPWLLDVHWGARIADDKGAEFMVDSWKAKRGTPVPIIPIKAWMRGADG
jgi:hypothetical protein